VIYGTKSMRIGKKANVVALITKNSQRISDENYNSQTNY